MPGGGAEVFSKGVRATIADKKLAGEDWIDVHRTAHELGIRSNCTMLYGHVESIEDRIEHLDDAARPAGRDGRLPRVHPARVPSRQQRARRAAGPRRARRRPASTTCAISRSAVCSSTTSTHIKTHWIMVTPFALADRAGVRRQRPRGHGRAREDLPRGGRAHGAEHDARRAPSRSFAAPGRSRPSAIRSINVLRTFDDGAERGGGVACASAAFRTSTATRSTGPSTAASSTLDARARRRRAVGAERAAWRAGELDVSVVSAVEYARDSSRYLLLPDLAISCDGPVRSVMLFSQASGRGARRPARARQPQLDDERRAARAAVRERVAVRARGSCRRTPS